MSAFGRRPSGATLETGSSTRPEDHPITGPLASLMATTPASVKMSAYDAPGWAFLTGSSHLTALARPALPPCASSSLKRIVPPREPPSCACFE